MTYAFYSNVITRINHHPNFTQLVKVIREGFIHNFDALQAKRKAEENAYEGKRNLVDPVPECVGRSHKWDKQRELYINRIKTGTSIRITQRCYDLWYAVEGKKQWEDNCLRIATATAIHIIH
jgi:hypothetical protein